MWGILFSSWSAWLKGLQESDSGFICHCITQDIFCAGSLSATDTSWKDAPYQVGHFIWITSRGWQILLRCLLSRTWSAVPVVAPPPIPLVVPPDIAVKSCCPRVVFERFYRPYTMYMYDTHVPLRPSRRSKHVLLVDLTQACRMFRAKYVRVFPHALNHTATPHTPSRSTELEVYEE